MKLHLVDGTFEMFRCFYGAPKRQTADGREVGALRTFLRTLLSLLADPEVTHLGVAFDHVIESFRNDLFDGYKTGEGIDPLLLTQLHPAEEAAAALGLVVWPMVEFEADDALAAAVHRFKDQVEQVVICSPDKDLAQCVEGDRVVLLDRIRKITLNEAAIIEKFGVGPASIPDYLALVGDSADGIPGLKGWGARSTATVLARYGHLEAIPPDPADWEVKVRGAKRLSEVLEAQRDEASLYRTLATLRADVPLPQAELEELRWRGIDRGRIEAFCTEIEDLRLLERLP